MFTSLHQQILFLSQLNTQLLGRWSIKFKTLNPLIKKYVPKYRLNLVFPTLKQSFQNETFQVLTIRQNYLNFFLRT